MPVLVPLLVGLALTAHGGPVWIVGAVPNPATPNDAGEYVLLHADGPTALGGYALDDGEDVVPLPNVTVSGTVAVTDDQRVARDLAGETTVVVADGLSLSNAGETVRLRRGNRTVSTLTYGRAPEAEAFRNGSWTPLGATDLPVFTGTDVRVEAFALPDDPAVPVDAIRGADRRLLLAGYTFADERAADAILDARRRGVRVAVLVEGGPVGGTPATEVRALDRLARAGVRVVVSGGDRARYDFHHAKYAVADDRVVVTSENWRPSGTGGHATRGWGVVVHDAALADRLASVFAADAGWVDGRQWSRVNETPQPATPANATFPTRFAPVDSTADSVQVVAAPDNAEQSLVGLLDEANETIDVEQVSVDPDGPLLAAAVRAARRGVAVRVLLDGTWYVADENRAVVDDLTRLAEREDLPIRAKLVEPRSRFERVHVKGVIVDGRRTVVGSINWNRHALRENREVAVIVEDRVVGRYYERLFRADWRGAAWRVHWLTVAGLVAAIAGSLWVGSRIEFEGDDG